MVHRLDTDVGRITKLIKQLGLTEQTLIIFTSDNGGHSTTWEKFDTNGPLRGHKRNLTEGGIRVPFVASWPGKIPQGTTSDEVIAFQDMLPTFSALAGAEFSHPVDGINVFEALKGNQLQNPHPYLYWDYGHNRQVYQQAVRMGKWKAIRSKRKVALYNLEDDPGEENDVASKQKKIVRKIEAIMEEAFVPDERYEVGKMYTGGPIWKKE